MTLTDQEQRCPTCGQAVAVRGPAVAIWDGKGVRPVEGRYVGLDAERAERYRLALRRVVDADGETVGSHPDTWDERERKAQHALELAVDEAEELLAADGLPLR